MIEVTRRPAARARSRFSSAPGRALGVVGGAPLAPAGEWALDVAVRVSEFDEFRTDFEVPLE